MSRFKLDKVYKALNSVKHIKTTKYKCFTIAAAVCYYCNCYCLGDLMSCLGYWNLKNTLCTWGKERGKLS